MKGQEKSVFVWVWKDLFLPRLSQFAWSTILGILGIGAQLGAYAILFRYVSAIEQQRRFVFAGFRIEPTASEFLLYAIAAATGLAFILSGLFNYWTRRYNLALANKYEVYCAQRLLHAINESGKAALLRAFNEGGAFTFRAVKKSLIKDTRFCGKVVLIILQSLLTMGKLILSLGFMVYVQAWLTVLIVLVSIPLVLLLRHSSKKVVQLTREREELLPEFLNEKKAIITGMITPRPETIKDWIQGYREGILHSFYRAYYGTFNMLAVNDLLITGFIALLAALIIIVAGNVVLFGSMSWTVFAAYMVALRFFFVSLQGINGSIKRSSRAYDYIRHYQFILIRMQGLAFAESGEEAHLRDTAAAELLLLGLDDDDDDDDEDDEM